MSSPYRTLGREELRAVLADEHFTTPAAGNESFELGVERFAVRFRGGVPEPVAVSGAGGLRELAERALGTVGGPAIQVSGPGEPMHPGGGLAFGPGGQVALRLSGPTPAEVDRAVERSLAALESACGAAGVRLVGFGQSPWHGPDELTAAAEAPVDGVRAVDGLLAESPLGRTVLRSAATQVRVAFGGAVHRATRWRAAELAAPFATGVFASSPLGWGGEGAEVAGHQGHKSQRARARQSVGSDRTGFVPSVVGETRGDFVEDWLEFGLEARIVGVDHGGRWVPPPHPFSFAQWMEHGIEGRYPDLDDWRAHLALLETEVYPAVGIELRCADALPWPFQGVPLTFFTGLLCDPGTAQAVIDCFDRDPNGGERGAEASSLREQWLLAGRTALGDVDLGAHGAWLFGRAAQGVLRLPDNWFSREQLARFAAFGRRYAARRLSLADEVLDTFLERGRLGEPELDLLARRWSGLVPPGARAA